MMGSAKLRKVSGIFPVSYDVEIDGAIVGRVIHRERHYRQGYVDWWTWLLEGENPIVTLDRTVRLRSIAIDELLAAYKSGER